MWVAACIRKWPVFQLPCPHNWNISEGGKVFQYSIQFRLWFKHVVVYKHTPEMRTSLYNQGLMLAPKLLLPRTYMHTAGVVSFDQHTSVTVVHIHKCHFAESVLQLVEASSRSCATLQVQATFNGFQGRFYCIYSSHPL